ncbi:hypothetical protein PRIPAC_70781 [Pristionchus pacificus]|uniref:Uncharacterized protein n=1 Tax=Pristionchus pacificus TaxID=54126 RepID=A0A2A6C7X0_PRIPA|nr:hypothetical protein PRIPAC_70781 [Pristionchus pacificus]|eukprot:PDM74200.1 hypothetical protein PRIPAC_41556 [Pristionchus pacificus]
MLCPLFSCLVFLVCVPVGEAEIDYLKLHHQFWSDWLQWWRTFHKPQPSDTNHRPQPAPHNPAAGSITKRPSIPKRTTQSQQAKEIIAKTTRRCQTLATGTLAIANAQMKPAFQRLIHALPTNKAPIPPQSSLRPFLLLLHVRYNYQSTLRNDSLLQCLPLCMQSPHLSFHTHTTPSLAQESFTAGASLNVASSIPTECEGVICTASLTRITVYNYDFQNMQGDQPNFFLETPLGTRIVWTGIGIVITAVIMALYCGCRGKLCRPRPPSCPIPSPPGNDQRTYERMY